MRKAAGLLRERAADIARLLTQEQGKPFAEARVEVMAGADIIEWFADDGRRVYGRIVPSRNLAAHRVRRWIYRWAIKMPRLCAATLMRWRRGCLMRPGPTRSWWRWL